MWRGRDRQGTRLVRWRAQASPVALLLLSLGALSTGCPASDEGTALLRNTSGQSPLEVVLRNPDGRRFAGGTMQEVYVFDTQFTDRQEQCLVARDGGFEVLRADGEAVAVHSFADRPVCEFDELELTEGGSLVWR